MIATTIQAALTPVFMLVAIGNIMNLLSTRLGRIVDRSRHLTERHVETSGEEHDAVVVEMRVIARRIAIISKAILGLVMSGISIGATVAILFAGEMAHIDLHRFAAAAFMLAVALMMYGLVQFLRETRLASTHLKVPKSLLELHRDI